MVKPTDAGLLVYGGLTNTFIHCDTCLSDEDFNRLRQQKFTEKENHTLHGQLSGSVTGMIEHGSVASNTQSRHIEKREAEQRRMARFAEIAEQLRASIEQMEADIRAMEELFEKRDGDAWREKLALNILGADDIPQQESGENINDYRKRLEQHLINEMLNPDGTIKGKYKNDSQYSDYAEWAQKQFHLNNAKAIAAELDDHSTSSQRREQLLDEMRERGYLEEMTFADRTTQNKDTQVSMRDLADNRRDEMLSRARSADAAMKFMS